MTVPLAMQAAEQMQKEFDVSVEVIDPRTIKPLDIDTIVNSVKKTNRLVIAEESHSFASVGAEISHQVMENAFDYLGRARQTNFNRRSTDAVCEKSWKNWLCPTFRKSSRRSRKFVICNK